MYNIPLGLCDRGHSSMVCRWWQEAAGVRDERPNCTLRSIRAAHLQHPHTSIKHTGTWLYMYNVHLRLCDSVRSKVCCWLPECEEWWAAECTLEPHHHLQQHTHTPQSNTLAHDCKCTSWAVWQWPQQGMLAILTFSPEWSKSHEEPGWSEWKLKSSNNCYRFRWNE